MQGKKMVFAPNNHISNFRDRTRRTNVWKAAVREGRAIDV